MIETRFDENDKLDELVSSDVSSFHLEKMDNGCWWIGLTHPDGSETHISLATARGAKIFGAVEEYAPDASLMMVKGKADGE